MNTTMTSNRNYRNGKVSSNRTQYDFSERSGCAGYALLFVLVAVAVAIFYFIATHA